eukprot:TRINITY_DN5631_c0_g1_i2.p1 TRINITY_DN5631_c0_g1~~TRINITY_DN5631_c0_g1_i2.p1  ORF type:complete len:218 (-),score=32.02 TRINITY_DN5631_c0_g1_i2:219-872(-)
MQTTRNGSLLRVSLLSGRNSYVRLYQSISYTKRAYSTETRSYFPPASLVLTQRDVNGVKLNSISDNKGAHMKTIRVGRGPGSGKGKTAGKGHKGQKARSKVRPGFEGGQNPMYKRVRKHGFSNYLFKRAYLPVNLDKIQLWIDQGRLDPTQKIDMKTLNDVGLVSRITKTYEHGYKLLASGKEWFQAKIDIEISKVSREAKQAVEKNGGTAKEVLLS